MFCLLGGMQMLTMSREKLLELMEIMHGQQQLMALGRIRWLILLMLIP